MRCRHTFLYAAVAPARHLSPKTEIAWLLKIAHNVCLSTWDSDRRRRRLELVQDPERLEELRPAEPSGHESAIALEDALGDLTEPPAEGDPPSRVARALVDEIAEELDLSQSAVETLLFPCTPYTRPQPGAPGRRAASGPSRGASTSPGSSPRSSRTQPGRQRQSRRGPPRRSGARGLDPRHAGASGTRAIAGHLSGAEFEAAVDLAVGVVDPPTLREYRAGAPKAKRDAAARGAGSAS